MTAKFDAKWYLDTYPDIAAALRDGVITSALEHYVRTGRGEGRRPHALAKRYVLHVGPHKTGSSSLQAALHSVRNRLERGGVVYPNIWTSTEGRKGHDLLPTALRTQESDQLAEEISVLRNSSAHTIILSAEDLVELDDIQMYKLGSLFSDDVVTVVFYIRRWSETLVSGWKENILHGATYSLPKFMIDHLGRPGLSHHINPGSRIQKFCNTFGRSCVKIISYNNISDVDEDIFTHFLSSILNVRLNGLPDVGRVHPSPDAHESELARVLNVSQSLSGGYYLLNKKYFDTAALFDEMRAYETRIELDGADGGFSSIEADVHARFGDLLIPPLHSGRFFAPKSHSVAYIDPNYLLNKSSRLLVENLARQVQRLRAAT